MTITSADPRCKSAMATADIAAERICLRCRSTFRSGGPDERICPRCMGMAVWSVAPRVGNAWAVGPGSCGMS